MGNIFNKATTYTINTKTDDESSIGVYENQNYNVRMYVRYKDDFTNPNSNLTSFYGRDNNSEYGRDNNSKSTNIEFFIEPDTLNTYSYDSKIEEGYKSSVVSSLLEYMNKSKFGKMMKYSPNFYITPMSNENTRNLYHSGDFTNLNFKFRLYDKNYLGNNGYKVSDPLTTFALLSSCIFPYGDNGKGGSIIQIVNMLKNNFSGDKFTSNVYEASSNLYLELAKLVGADTKKTEELKHKNLYKVYQNLMDRINGCPTIVFYNIGDIIYSQENDEPYIGGDDRGGFIELPFYLTNFNASFSKDLINSDGVYKPIYIDFEITLTPTKIPSSETMVKFINGVYHKSNIFKRDIKTN